MIDKGKTIKITDGLTPVGEDKKIHIPKNYDIKKEKRTQTDEQFLEYIEAINRVNKQNYQKLLSTEQPKSTTEYLTKEIVVDFANYFTNNRFADKEFLFGKPNEENAVLHILDSTKREHERTITFFLGSKEYRYFDPEQGLDLDISDAWLKFTTQLSQQNQISEDEDTTETDEMSI